jgi:signal transduction histidine kinase
MSRKLFQQLHQRLVVRKELVVTYLRYGWPVLGLIMMIAMAGGLLLADLAKEQDRAYTTSSRNLVQQAINSAIESNATYSTEYSLWNDAYENTTLKEDPEWMETNFHPSNAGAMAVYRQGVGIRYMYVKLGFESTQPDIERYVAALDLSAHGSFSHSRNQDDIVTSPKSLAVFDGQLAAVAVEPIRPERASNLPRPTAKTPLDFVVFISFISAKTAQSIGRSNGLAQPELHVSDVQQPPREGRVGLDLTDAEGKLVARIDWIDAMPGSRAFASRLIPITLVLLGVGILTVAVTQTLVARQIQLSEAARLAAEEASQQKSSFLANVSHELRTPLNAIIGYSEILEEDALDAQNETGASDAKKVTRAANHLLALINDLLDHSKIEAGKMDFNPSQTQIGPLVEEVAEALRVRAEDRGNQINIAYDPSIGEALLDSMRLKQCLLNLASNAVKFTQDGVITISARPVDHFGVASLRFTIKDTGIGMAPATIDKLFVPFVQADETTSQKFGGTGLGLVITRRLIDAMGGQVQVESAEGQGSSFTIIIPRGMDWAGTTVPAQSDGALEA